MNWKKIKFEWLRYLWIIDLIGLGLGLVPIIIYLYYANDGWGTNNFQTIWANLSTSIFATWIGVRLIDLIIQSRDSTNKARLYIIDNYLHFRNVANNISEYENPYESDLQSLKDEVTCREERWKNRMKYFEPSEKNLIGKLNSIEDRIYKCSIELFELIELNKSTTHVRLEIKDLIHSFQEELHNLRRDIWEESHPDEN